MSHITMTQLYGSSCYKCAFQMYKGYQKYFIHSSSRSWRADKFRNVPQLRKFDRKKLDTSPQSSTLEPASRTKGKDASECFKYSKEQMRQFETNPHPSSSESVLYSLSTAVSCSPHDERRDREHNIQSKSTGRDPQLSPELKPFSRTRTTSRNFPEEQETVRSLKFKTNRKSSDRDETSFSEPHQTSRNSSVLFSEINFPRTNTGMREIVEKQLAAPLRSHPPEPRERRRVTYDFLEEPSEFPERQSVGDDRSRSSSSEASRDSHEEKTRTGPGETRSPFITYDFLREDDIEISNIERTVQGNKPASRNILEEEIDDRMEQSKTDFQSLSPEPMVSSKNAGVPNALPTFATVEEALIYLANNANIDVKLFASIFETIDTLLKRGLSKLSTQEISRRGEMENLSKNVRENPSSLEAEDALVIVKVLTNLGISMNSVLVYSLKMLLKSINKLELKHILSLNRVVTSHSQGESNSLLKAFEMTLPMVFEMQVRRSVTECDVYTLARAVAFAVSHDSNSDETLQMLVAELTRRIDQMSPFHAHKIMALLPKAHRSRFRLKPLYRKLNEKMEADLEEFPNRTLVRIICGSIIQHLRKHDDEFLNVDFFKRTISPLFRERSTLSLKDAEMLLYKLNYENYYCPELLDYMDEQFEKTPALTAREISFYVRACSNNMHKPRRWNSYEERMLASVDSLKMRAQTRFVADLLVLQCWPEKLVARCLSETFLNQLQRLNLLKDSVIIRLQSIQEMVKVFRPFDYSGPFLPDHLVEKAVTLQRELRNYGLNDSLQRGLGGQEYVLNGVKTESGQVIDHLVVKFKSSKPCAVNPSKIIGSCDLSYESLKLPADSHSLAIMHMAPTAFCNLGSSRLTGRNQIRLRCLEAKGITPIPIPDAQWLKLSTDERVTYLMDRIDSTFSQDTNLRTFDQRS